MYGHDGTHDGHLKDGAVLGGRVKRDAATAERALMTLAEPLCLDAVAIAEGACAVARAEMTRALRVISVERGLDPRDFSVLAFGGAGPMHACDVAEDGITATREIQSSLEAESFAGRLDELRQE